MRALIVQHEPDGPAGEIRNRLEQRGIEIHEHVVTSDYAKPDVAAPFPNFSDFDFVVIMGSIRSLTNKAQIGSWIYTELQELRKAVDADQPILGICFGGQLLAEVLGGTVCRSPSPEIGWYLIAAPHGANNPVGPGPWMEWHEDRFTAPPQAEVLATTDSGQQLFRLKRFVGTQFHPEVNLSHVETWLSLSDDKFLERFGVTKRELRAESERNEANNITQCHDLVDWFLDEVAFPLER